MSKQNKFLKDSEITGFQRADKTLSSATGLQLGETGCVKTNHVKAEVVQWLESKTMSEVNEAVQCLVQHSNCSMKVESTMMFPADKPAYRKITKIEIEGGEAESKSLHERLSSTLLPASDKKIMEWLAKLSVLSPQKQADENTNKAKLLAYTEQLSQYPADIVRHVLLGQSWKFFPSWHELKEDLEPLKASRVQLVNAFQKPLTAIPADYEPTEEEKKTIKEGLKVLTRQLQGVNSPKKPTGGGSDGKKQEKNTRAPKDNNSQTDGLKKSFKPSDGGKLMGSLKG